MRSMRSARAAASRRPARPEQFRRPAYLEVNVGARKAVPTAAIGPKRADGTYRARYRDRAGKEHARHFKRRVDAQRWLDETTTSLVTGAYVAPGAGRITFREYHRLLDDLGEPDPVAGGRAMRRSREAALKIVATYR
jgi:hypothetical protein